MLQVHGFPLFSLKKVIISSVDSDVVIQAVHFFDEVSFNELRVKFGAEKTKGFSQFMKW